MFQTSKKHFRFSKIIVMSASFMLAGIFIALKPVIVQAANSLNVGTDTSILNSGDNLFYGDFSASSNAGSNAILIQKPSGTNLFKVDSSGNMLVTGNVGIGTTAPNSKFNAWVGSSDNSAGSFTYASQNLSILAGRVLTGTWPPSIATTTMTIQSSGPSSGEIAFATGNTERMRIAQGGSVGIGNTAPGTNLDVTGSFRDSSATTLSALNNNGNVVVMADNNGTLFSTPLATFTSANSLWGGTKNSNIWNGDSGAGNVGIGTIAPGAKLDVHGVGTSTAFTFQASDSSGNPHVSILDNGNVGIGTTGPLSRLDVLSSGSALGTADAVGATGNFESTTPIGQSSTLSLVGNDTIAANIGGVLGFGGRYSGSSYANWASIKGLKTNATAGDYSGYLAFFTRLTGAGSVERMRIDNNGNVGIGTTNPGVALWNDSLTAKLDTAGNIRINSGSQASTGEIDSLQFAKYHTTLGAQYQYSLGEIRSFTTDGYAGGLRFYTSGGTNNVNAVMTLNNLGNVGIGTINPGYSLDAYTPNTSDAYYRFQRQDTSRAVGISLANSTIDQWRMYMPASSTDLRFYNNGVDKMVITNGGNVGIGNTNPTYKLDFATLNGTTDTNSIRLGVYNGPSGGGGTTPGGGIVWIPNYGGYTKRSAGILQIAESNYFQSGLAFYTNGTADNTTDWSERMRITSGGSVGIGTTTPQATLDVNGLIKMRSTSITQPEDVINKAYLTSVLTAIPSGSSTTTQFSGNLNMGGYNITNVGKITVTTIDPLYNINKINYSTFASAIAGGVKEEAVGKIKVAAKTAAGDYQAVIDFNHEPVGSDLWVWHKIVDFNADNVEVLLTPYNSFAQAYYSISGESLIIHTDRPATIAYRLIGKRLDWRQWPTKALNQTETASFIIK